MHLLRQMPPMADPAGPPIRQVQFWRQFIRVTLPDRIALGELTEGQRVAEATLVAEFAIIIGRYQTVWIRWRGAARTNH